MNKKGFTVIELTVSFALVSIISIMLFNLIFSLKELYVSGDIKTSLLNKQAIMDKKIYDDLNTRDLKSITACGISCLTFTYADGTAQFLIDVGANTIKYDDYTMRLTDGTTIGQVKFEIYNPGGASSKENAVFNLDIPIKSSLLDDDFGIHIVKRFNSTTTTINKNLNFSSAKIIANGIPVILKTITNNEDWTITRDSTRNLPIISLTETSSEVIFARIFHQENGTAYTSYDDFVKNKNANRLSTLKSLEAFRSTKRTNELKNVLKSIIDATSVSSSERERMRRNLSSDYINGYFEFIIDYPSLNGNQSLVNYNRWMQTSNFTTSKSLERALAIDAVDNGGGTWENGLRYINNKSFVSGSSGSAEKFAIGMKKNGSSAYPLIGASGQVDSVDLWVRANDYISKYGLVTLVY